MDATAAEAWQMYGLSNGVDSENELVEKITYFARRRSQNFSPSTDPIIGCIELVDVITRGRHRNGSPAVYFGGHDLKPGDGGRSEPRIRISASEYARSAFKKRRRALSFRHILETIELAGRSHIAKGGRRHGKEKIEETR